MKNKLLLPLLGLLVLALFFIWMGGAGDDLPAEGTLTDLAPGTSSSTGASGTKAEPLPELATSVREEPVRESVETAEDQPPESSVSPFEKPSSNAVWISGRVAFPDNMPNDMGGIVVTARGRRFSDKDDSRREHKVEIGRDGRFRVALSKSTRIGWLDVRGRYLYLPEKVRVDMKEVPDEVILEPEMGGVVSGIAKAPVGQNWNEDTCEGAQANLLGLWSSTMVRRSSNVDTNGHFEFTGVPPSNEYRLALELSYWTDASKSGIKVESGQVTEVTLETQAGSHITGRVIDEENVGRVGINVELSGDATIGSWMRETTQTKDDGSFEFRGVGEGTITIKASINEFLPVETDLGLVPAGSRRTGILLTISEGHFIQGMVQWPDGSPAVGAFVRVSQDREAEGLMFSFDDSLGEKTAADGSFRITGLEPSECVVRAMAKSFRQKDLDKAKQREKDGRSYKLRARGPVYKTRVDEVQPGTRGLMLTLAKGDSLSGRVVDDLGEGLKRFMVSAEPIRGQGSDLERADKVNRLIISLDGSFTIDGLRDGRWKVSARATGHDAAEEVVITSPGAGEIELVAARLGMVSGVVRGPGGDPVSGARIWVEHLDEDEEFELLSFGRSYGEDATTNQNGEFTAKDVPPGRTRVAAGSDDMGSSEGVLVQVAPGSEVEGLSLRLRQPARIRGQLHASVGVLEGRSIRVRGEGPGSYWKNPTTDSRGRFELEGLDAGTYNLTLEDDDDDDRVSPGLVSASSQRTVAAEVEVAAGETVSVVLGAPPANPTTVSGRVMSGSEGLAGVFVTCRASSKGDLNNDSTRTDSNGEYALTLSGSGDFNFSVGSPSGGMLAYRRALVEGANPGTDFTLSMGTISGMVTGMNGNLKNSCSLVLQVVKLEVESTSSSSTRSIKTDSQGRYEFDFVDPGEYLLRVNDSRASWRDRSRTQEGTELREGIVLAEGQNLEGFDFDLREEGVIEGHVTGADGQPVSGVRISARTAAGNRIHRRALYYTNAQGEFVYKRLGAGRVFLSASGSDQVEVSVQAGSTSQVALEGGTH